MKENRWGNSGGKSVSKKKKIELRSGEEDKENIEQDQKYSDVY